MPTVAYERSTIRSVFQANSWTTDDQLRPDVLGLSNGGYVVAYNNSSGGGYILLNFYAANGSAVGSYEVPYSSPTSDATGAPSLTQLSNGNVLVVWADTTNSDTAADGIRGSIFTSAGTAVNLDFTISGFTGDFEPEVAALTGGGYVVTYQSSGGFVYRRVFDNTGGIVSGETGVSGSGLESDPAVVGLADGGFVITWTDTTSGVSQIWAEIHNANGTIRDPGGAIATFGNNTQSSLAALPNGNFVVAYTDTGWSEGAGISLSIHSPTGSFVKLVHVNTESPTKAESDPDVTVLDNGMIVVSWTYPFSASDNDIFGKVYFQNGDPETFGGSSGVLAFTISDTDDLYSTISAIRSGEFIVGWQDSETDVSGGRISARIDQIVRTTTGDGTAETLTGDQLRDIINGAGGNDIITGGLGTDSLTGGTGFDIFRDTAAGLNGDTLTDFGRGDRIHVTDATFAGFTYGFGGGTLAFTGGSVSTTISNEYRVVARPAAGGGVELLLNNSEYDFNGDGRGDLVWRNADGSFTTWLGQPNGSMAPNPGSAANALGLDWTIRGIGDFNGDGRDDILWRQSGGEIGQWLGQSNGVFANNGGAAANAVDNSWTISGIADFNGDGRDDILWRHSSGEVGQWTGQTNGGFLNNGGAAANAVDPSWTVATTGDFNGDGYADVLWRHSSGVYAEWQGTSTGALVNAGAVMAGAAGSVVGSGDFNGDGREDILTRTSNGAINLWLGQSSGQFTSFTPTSQVLDLNWKIVGIGDYNGDGRDDLMWRHSSGQAVEWLGTTTGDFVNNGALPTVENVWQIQSPDIFLI